MLLSCVCKEGRIVQGKRAALRKAVHSQSQVSAIVLDLARGEALLMPAG